MYEEIIELAKAHALSVWPHEACGLVINRRGRLAYRPCANKAETPWADFMIDPQEFAEVSAEGEVVAVVHSHPDAPGALSPKDQSLHKAAGLDWLVLGFPDGPTGALDQVLVKASTEKPPLTGRTFVHAVSDCYSLIRDYYTQECNIILPDFLRQDEWWNKGEDLYQKHFAEAGFRRVYDLQKHDIIIMTIASPVPNHGAILVRPDNGVILHHLTGRLSCEEVYTSFYRDRTTMVIRHENY